MTVLSICNSADVLSVIRIIKIAIKIIKIAVPILLILSLMISYVKAMVNNDDSALENTNKTVVSKVVAAILIFFIPTFVNLIGDVAGIHAYQQCIGRATKEGIIQLRYEEAVAAVDKAYESISESDYNKAISLVGKIEDADLRDSFSAKLTSIRYYLDIRADIAGLKDLSAKDAREKYKELYDKIEKITDERIKKMLMELLEKYGKGRPLDAEPGLHENLRLGAMSYHLVVPPHPTTNMALWIFLHGDGGQTTGGFTHYVSHGKAYTTEEFFYIAPSPIPFRQEWSGGSIPSDLKKLIDYLVDKYEIDKDRIIISGFSRGAIGTWTMVNNYPDLFSVAYPVSCRPVGVQAKNFVTTVIRAHAGDIYGKYGMYEGEYADDMSALVTQIKKLGGDATMTIHHGKKHGEVNYILQQKETVEFALSVTKKR